MTLDSEYVRVRPNQRIDGSQAGGWICPVDNVLNVGPSVAIVIRYAPNRLWLLALSEVEPLPKAANA